MNEETKNLIEYYKYWLSKPVIPNRILRQFKKDQIELIKNNKKKRLCIK